MSSGLKKVEVFSKIVAFLHSSSHTCNISEDDTDPLTLNKVENGQTNITSVTTHPLIQTHWESNTEWWKFNFTISDLQYIRGWQWSHSLGWNGQKWRLGSFQYWFSYRTCHPKMFNPGLDKKIGFKSWNIRERFATGIFTSRIFLNGKMVLRSFQW